MSRVSVIIRRSPFNTFHSPEGLRMAVGQVLSDHAVTVVFVEDGVYALLDTQPETIGAGDIAKPIEMLHALGHCLIAEEESLKERGVDRLHYPVQVRSRADIADLIARSEVVVPW